MSDESEAIKPPVVIEQGRNPLGWVMLAILLLATFVASYTPAAKPHPSRFVNHDLEQALLQQAVNSDSLLRSMSFATGKSPEEIRKPIVANLDDSISNLVLQTGKDPMAAMLYAAMRTFQGASVPADHLQLLANSSHPEDKAFYEIYTSPKLTRERAKQLVAVLPKEPFVYKAAAIQALTKAGDSNALFRLAPPESAIFMLLAQFVAIPVFAVCVAIWMIVFRRSITGNLKFLGLPIDPVSHADADRLAIRAAHIFGMFAVLYAVVPLLPIPGTNGAVRLGIASLLLLVGLKLIQSFPVGGKLLLLKTLGISRENLGRHIGIGVLAFIAEMPVMLFLAEASTSLLKNVVGPADNPAAKALMQSRDWATAVAMIVAGAIVAPIWEETVFRGLIFPGLKKLTGGLAPAAIVSSFLFASVHAQGPALWVPLTFLGCVSCFLVYKTRSLVPSIVMHCLHNLTLFVLVLLIR